ncbi:MAG: LysM peptidoglycan-binding domain-containing protein, partial [Aerococcus sp.]|nr:LysM peptidoglycan-binding domain-containing protein [Aerococcus sp.]
MNKVVSSALVTAFALSAFAATHNNTAHAAENNWTPRTVEQIKADIDKTNDDHYTIVWGDTLSAISQATNITIQKLAQINQIANIDLIYAGNTLYFEQDAVVVKDKNGKTMERTTVSEQEKVDPKQPVGATVKPSTNQQTTTQKENQTVSNDKGNQTHSTVVTPSKPNKPQSSDKPADKPSDDNQSTNQNKPSDNNKPTDQNKPSDTDKPVTPNKPTEPEKPETPDKPSEPEKPETPDKPTE